MNNRKKRKKQKKNKFISDINIVSKSIIIFILVLIPIAFLTVQSFFLISENVKNKKSEMEIVEVNALEGYFGVTVESIVSIAKTIYSNEKIYEFLNTDYASNIDYFNAYYQFTESKTLIISETSAIKESGIYTANPTIMKGGNIKCLDQSTMKEKWYTEFHNMNKNLMIYCDEEHGTLSLIRKLDFMVVKTGEALLKIDINIANIQKNFEGMNFDGKVYVTSGNILVYGNEKKAEYSDIYNLPQDEVTKKTANFYTATIEFYSSARTQNVMKILLSNPANIAFGIVFLICCVGVLYIIFDIRIRIMKLSKVCEDDFVNMHTDDFGDDEIGKLHRGILDILNKMNIFQIQNQRLNDYISRYTSKASVIENNAFDLDAEVCYMDKYGKEAGKNPVNAGELITLEREILNLKKYIEFINQKNNGLIDYNIQTDTKFTNDVYILPLSLVLITADIIENVLKEKQSCRFDLKIWQKDEKINISFLIPDISFSSSKLLRLRSVFESDGGEEMPEFELAYNCNPYIRLRKNYSENININIISDSQINFELVFNKKVLYKNTRLGLSELI